MSPRPSLRLAAAALLDEHRALLLAWSKEARDATFPFVVPAHLASL